MSREFCPLENEGCKYFTRPGGCFADTHHLYFPAGQYQRPIEKEYRELPHHKVQICRAEHDEIHATQEAPTKPDREEMVRAIGSYAMKEQYGEA